MLGVPGPLICTSPGIDSCVCCLPVTHQFCCCLVSQTDDWRGAQLYWSTTELNLSERRLWKFWNIFGLMCWNISTLYTTSCFRFSVGVTMALGQRFCQGEGRWLQWRWYIRKSIILFASFCQFLPVAHQFYCCLVSQIDETGEAYRSTIGRILPERCLWQSWNIFRLYAEISPTCTNLFYHFQICDMNDHGLEQPATVTIMMAVFHHSRSFSCCFTGRIHHQKICHFCCPGLRVWRPWSLSPRGSRPPTFYWDIYEASRWSFWEDHPSWSHLQGQTWPCPHLHRKLRANISALCMRYHKPQRQLLYS